jgi:type 1 fimbriae regulatory protein FimB/type 1 fimbriae regulatory protein FimE
MEMAATVMHLGLVAPDNKKFTVQLAPARLPRRKSNAEYRSREHLTEREVERLIEAMTGNRWGHRDATMVLMAFRHGLRASELVDLRWHQVDLEHALLHVRRLKNGSPATHPLTGKELRALRRPQREQDLKSPFVFTSERGTPFTKRGFQAMVERAGEAAGFDMKIHPRKPCENAVRLPTGRPFGLHETPGGHIRPFTCLVGSKAIRSVSFC